MKFKVLLELSIRTKGIVENKKSYYLPTKYDEITISDREIIIEGERSNKVSFEDFKFNQNNGIHKQFLKSLLYLYFTRGNCFKIKKITFEQGTKNIESSTIFKDDLNQLFIKPLNHKINSSVCERVFNYYSSNSQNKFFNALSLFVIGLNNQDDFDPFWKAFNSIYNAISSKNQEKDKIKDARMFIENNWDRMILCESRCNTITKDYIRNFSVREFIFSEFKKNANGSKEYSNMVCSFTDKRIIELFDDIKSYKNDLLLAHGYLNDVNNHISNLIVHNILKNSDIIRFLILKYAYYLRCKYFHAEKACANFVVKNTNDEKNLVNITSLLKTLLYDLLNCADLYVI
ncbi:MAG: hypothetical protein K6E20_01710 [Acholeplasmatales bacterium]|nr:hypothetical protein [Acholeplasmatales bacterium]